MPAHEETALLAPTNKDSRVPQDDLLRRTVDAGLRGRIGRLEAQVEKECPVDVDEVQFFSVSAGDTYTRIAPLFYCGDYESGVLCRCTIQCKGCADRSSR